MNMYNQAKPTCIRVASTPYDDLYLNSTGVYGSIPGLPLLGVHPNRGLDTARVLSSQPEASACAACKKWDFKPASGDGDLVVWPVLGASEKDKLVDVKEAAMTMPDSCASLDCMG